MIKIKDIYNYISISEILIFNIVFIDILKFGNSFLNHIIIDTFVIIIYIFMLINLVILINSNIQRRKLENLNYEINKLNIKYNNEYRRTLQNKDKQTKKNKRTNKDKRESNKITSKKTNKNCNTNENNNQNIIRVNSNNIFRNNKIIKKISSYNSITDTIHHKVDKNINTDKNNINKNSELKVVHI